ncbi:MAG: DUF1311 domain-containing protein [Lachnospiraceae bacterium]|nr:DUF1311 domain-containing protein [Lachnospiraceae bacterium]
MKKVISILLVTLTTIFTGCISPNTNGIQATTAQTDATKNSTTQDNIKKSDDKVETANPKNDNVVKKHDFFNDYKSEIESEVENAISKASSLQDEINQIQKIANTYADNAALANTQSEMNSSSAWTYTVWDTELNNLWKRISSSASKDVKERILNEQRNWISMKNEITIENIGAPENSGSIYPLLQNNFLSDITHNRCLILARELAIIKHEDFVMPDRSIYGTFVDNQETGNVYGSLITRKNMENDNEAIISIYRLTTVEGTFIEKENGDLAFTSYEENVKGTIKIFGWEKAVFEVTECKDSPFNVGDSFTFDFAF